MTPNTKIGVEGDYAHIEGGIHFGLSKAQADKLLKQLDNQKVVDRLSKELATKDIALEDYQSQIDRWVSKYKELKDQLAKLASNSTLVAEAKEKLDAGDLEGADAILSQKIKYKIIRAQWYEMARFGFDVKENTGVWYFLRVIHPDGEIKKYNKAFQNFNEILEVIVEHVSRLRAKNVITNIIKSEIQAAVLSQEEKVPKDPNTPLYVAAAITTLIGTPVGIGLSVLLSEGDKKTAPKKPPSAKSSKDRAFLTKNQQDVVYAPRGGYELVRIPGGKFIMGSPDWEIDRFGNEGPQHLVRLPEFYMGRYPVTNEEYGLFLTKNTAVAEPGYWGDRSYNQSRQPVVGVSWDDARRYASWAGLMLPSETQWEYACRGGTQTRYYSGVKEKDLGRVGWYDKNSDDKLHPVGEREPNKFGLYDMHGNVWEWVEDDWHDNYKGAPEDGRAWINNPRGSDRVIRGGSWSYPAGFCRSACRFGYAPDGRGDDLGFRLVLLPGQPG